MKSEKSIKERDFQKFSDSVVKSSEFFLLTGSETFLKALARDRILELKQSEDLEVQKWTGSDLDEEAFWLGFQNFSLFSQNQLWIISEGEKLNASFFKTLKTTWERKTPGLSLILEGQFEKSSTPESLGALGVYCEFLSPFPSQIAGWVRKISQWQKVQIDDDALARLIEKYGSHLEEHKAALITLKNFRGEGKLITGEDVQNVLSSNQEESLFQVIDSFFDRHQKEFFHKASRLWLQGEAPTALVSLLVRQIRILIKVHHGLALRLDDTQMARMAEVAPFFIKKYTKQTGLWPVNELESLIVDLAELDQMLKGSELSTGSPGGLLLEERLARYL